jgi:hypothetical protein
MDNLKHRQKLPDVRDQPERSFASTDKLIAKNTAPLEGLPLQQRRLLVGNLKEHLKIMAREIKQSFLLQSFFKKLRLNPARHTNFLPAI